MTGWISFGQVCALFLVGLGFGGYLHEKMWGVWTLLLGIVGFLFFLILWVRSLLTVHVNPKKQALRERKRVIAIRLVFLWLASLSSSFALIPLYYWLNGNGGHVHGASSGMIQDEVPVTLGEKVSVFFTADVNTYRLPVMFSIEPSNALIEPGQTVEIILVIHNPTDQYHTYHIGAKPSPSEIQPYIHYDLIGNPITIDVAAGATKRLPYHVHVTDVLPGSVGNISIAHFLYGEDRTDNWKKMQAGWPNV